MTTKILRYAGFAEEKTYAESPPPDAVFHVDIASTSLDVPSDVQMIYGGGLARGPYLHRPGFYAPEGDIVYAFDIRTIGFLLKWVLGGYKFESGEPDPLNTHTFWGSNKNILDSFCARLGKDVFEHIFSGCVLNSLAIKVEGEYCEATASVIASKDIKTELKSIGELLLPDEYPLAFYEVTAKIAGNDYSAKIKGFTLTINNGMSADTGKTIGSRYPRLIRAGEREVTLSKTLMFDDTSELERYWGAESGPSDTGTEEFTVEINFDAGDNGSLKITLPRFIYTSVEQKPSGRDALEQPTNGRGFLPKELTGVDETDTDITVELKNKEEDMSIPES
jgi:hypothetical protein